jgi:hypothetical protein
MKRIVVIGAALLTLASVSVATATASSASVCEPNGTGCTLAGTYPGPNALINSNYGGFKLVWTKSVVQPYSSGVPLYWTVWVTYTNTDSSTLTLSCPADATDLSAVQEHMSGGSGDDGTVGGYSTTCSDNPGWTADVPPGGTAQVYTTFHNVPWPGSAVAITWYTAGTTAYVNPFPTATSPVFSNANWNGYVTGDPGKSITLVSSEWTIPADACGGAPGLGVPWQDSIWVGLGGINIGAESKTPLVQIGTFSKCDYHLSGLHFKVRQQSWAVEEVVYPDKSCCNEVTGRPVATGDTIYAYVENYGPGKYDMYLADKTQGWHWGPIDVTVPDTRTPFSAEWIVESGVGFFGLFPMADFKKVGFTGMYYETTTAGVIAGHGLTDSGVARLIAGTQTRVAPLSDYTGVIKWRALY